MKISYALLCIIVALVSVIATAAVYSIYTTYKVEIIAIDYEVPTDIVLGFNVDVDALHFGEIPRGSTSLRQITVQYHRDARVIMYPLGIENIYMGRNNFVMPKDTPTTINITVTIPTNATPGKYKGKLKTVFKRP